MRDPKHKSTLLTDLHLVTSIYIKYVKITYNIYENYFKRKVFLSLQSVKAFVAYFHRIGHGGMVFTSKIDTHILLESNNEI